MAGTNHRIRFMTNNRAESTLGTASTADATNVFLNTQSENRSKYWTTTGNFVVDSGNEVISINDGSSNSVAVANGTYTTRAALATAVQTALNTVSSSWICTHDSTTGFFTIDRSSGTKILELSIQFNDIWNLLGYTGTSDITAGIADERRWHQDESIFWDMGTSVDCSFFAAIYKAGKDLELSSTGTYTIQANSINSFTSPPLNETMTVSSDGLFHFMTSASTNYRYWKFIYNNSQNTVGDFPISHIYLGDYGTMSTTNVSRGFSKSLEDSSKKQTSIGGQEYFAVKTKRFKFSSMSINHLTDAERQIIEGIFSSVGITEPFYISVDPTLCISSALNDMTKFVRMSKSPVFKQLFMDRFDTSFSVNEVI